MKISIIKLICTFCLILGIISCDKDDHTPSKQKVNRTLLVYLGGDNNLSSEVQQKVNALLQGSKKINDELLIVTDSYGEEYPVLWRVEKENEAPVLKKLKSYTNSNSADAQVMAEAIADMKIYAPNQSYGMILFSHGTGWLPESSFYNIPSWENAASKHIAPTSLIEDKGREMELIDFAKAIPSHTFEFIVFDMCFMATAETLYALQEKTKYIVASAPEILSPGFTEIYSSHLELLYKPQADLKGFAQAFFQHWNSKKGFYQSACISLIDTQYTALLKEKHLSLYKDLSAEQISTIQAYDRTADIKVFFDCKQYLMQIAPNEKEKQEIEAIFSKLIPYKESTGKIIAHPINYHSGLAVYIPQTNLPKMNEKWRLFLQQTL